MAVSLCSASVLLLLGPRGMEPAVGLGLVEMGLILQSVREKEGGYWAGPLPLAALPSTQQGSAASRQDGVDKGICSKAAPAAFGHSHCQCTWDSISPPAFFLRSARLGAATAIRGHPSPAVPSLPAAPCAALHLHTSWGRAALPAPVLHCSLLGAPPCTAGRQTWWSLGKLFLCCC